MRRMTRREEIQKALRKSQPKYARTQGGGGRNPDTIFGSPYNVPPPPKRRKRRPKPTLGDQKTKYPEPI